MDSDLIEEMALELPESLWCQADVRGCGQTDSHCGNGGGTVFR
jgi:hypothetical protein